NHPSVEDYSRKCFEILEEILKTEGLFQLMIIDSELIINKQPLHDGGIHAINLIKRLKRKGITRVDILQGIIQAEFTQFLYDIAIRQRKVKPYPHIKTGMVEVSLQARGTAALQDGLDAFRNLQLDRVRSVYKNISPFKRLDVSGIEDIVLSFFSVLKQEANLLRLLSPVRTYSEYTYTHATNVAIIAMFIAESMGFEEFIVHEIGIAALLHDVGKLFVPKEVLEKKGKLDDREFSQIMEHPLKGADYLLNVDDITPLAPVAAFEHHIKYDGRGYPPVKNLKKKQHLASQIIAIADFFDALRSHRPYKRSWKVEEIFSLMRENAGRDFNPLLVEHFTEAYVRATGGGG
ncbi:MAG: HD domain-containing protein, partial [Nitrospirae bacterium]